MSARITVQNLHKSLLQLCDTMEKQKNYLSQLDGAIGDGDHGINMAKCFRGVKQKLAAATPQDIGGMLNLVGSEIMNSIGGASGALYGTLFLSMANGAQAKSSIGLEDLVVMFKAALAGVRAIGKAEADDKTMLDTLLPAVEGLEKSQKESQNLASALTAFDKAAHNGMESTKDMKAKIGRASRLGDRTLGHLDAGSVSCFYILKAFVNAYDE